MPPPLCVFSVEIRCRVLHLNPHGRYTCSQGFVVDSRCDYTCKAGYRIIGQHSRTCQPDGSWSNNEPVCTGTVPVYLDNTPTFSWGILKVFFLEQVQIPRNEYILKLNFLCNKMVVSDPCVA